MKADITQCLLRQVNHFLQSSYQADALSALDLQWSRQAEHGHFSSRICFRLAKTLRQAPNALAQAMVEAFKDQLDARIERIDAVNGYLNLTLTDQTLHQALTDILAKGDAYGVKPESDQRMHLEYVSANPTGPLHVGHGRGAALGSALAAILRTQGHQIDEVYYVNDCGRQIEILAMSVWIRALQALGVDAPFPPKAYQGDYIKKMAEDWTVEHGPCATATAFPYIDMDDEEAMLDQAIGLCRSVMGAETFMRLMHFASDHVMQGISADLAHFGVNQVTFKESELMTSGAIKAGITHLRQRQCLEDIDGQTWFKSSAYGDDKDRVLVREDGRHTYFAADVAYHLQKFAGPYSTVIDVFGSDHHGYVPRLKALLRACEEDPERLQVLLVQFATLYRGDEKVSMSTRSGQFVTLRELIDEVGVDATRFFYLMRKSEQHMDFDIELAKSRSMDNPVYYVQYAHARICRILEKQPLKTDLAQFDGECGQQMMLLLLQYPDVLSQCAQQWAVQPLVQYVRDLAAAFHRYYANVRVVCDDEALTHGRLQCILGVRIVLRNVLNLLGVHAPNAM